MAKRNDATPSPRKTRESETSVRKVLAGDRQRQIVQMRIGGGGYADIAKRLKIAPSTVGRALKRAMEVWKVENSELIEEQVHLQIKRLDRMILAIWPEVITGNLLAIDRALRIEERRARLLGFDKAPYLAVEHTGIIGHEVIFKVDYGDPDRPGKEVCDRAGER